jgi:hypothetical protein
MKIRELLTDESKWCKGNSAVDAEGYPVFPSNHHATRWCLYGASVKVGFNALKVLEAIQKRLPGIESIGEFNDGSSFSDVKALVEEFDL